MVHGGLQGAPPVNQKAGATLPCAWEPQLSRPGLPPGFPGDAAVSVAMGAHGRGAESRLHH